LNGQGDCSSVGIGKREGNTIGGAEEVASHFCGGAIARGMSDGGVACAHTYPTAAVPERCGQLFPLRVSKPRVIVKERIRQCTSRDVVQTVKHGVRAEHAGSVAHKLRRTAFAHKGKFFSFNLWCLSVVAKASPHVGSHTDLSCGENPTVNDKRVP
jgi:hypothetical protein